MKIWQRRYEQERACLVHLMRLLKGRNTPCTATRPVVAGDSCHGIARNYRRALPFDAGVFRSVAEQRLVVGRKLWVAEQLTRRTGFLLESRISLSLVRDGVARHPPHSLLHGYMYNNQLHILQLLLLLRLLQRRRRRRLRLLLLLTTTTTTTT